MKSTITRSLTVSLAIAAAIALPSAVRAQATSFSEPTPANTAGEKLINTDTNWCVRIPGYGWLCR